MEIKQAARRYGGDNVEIIYIRRKGEAANINVYRRNAKPYHSITEDRPRKSSNKDPKNSSVSNQRAREQEDKICKYWMSGHCSRGDKCWYLHSWCRGDGFTMLAKLEGHKKVVIASEFRVFTERKFFLTLSSISCFSKL